MADELGDGAGPQPQPIDLSGLFQGGYTGSSWAYPQAGQGAGLTDYGLGGQPSGGDAGGAGGGINADSIFQTAQKQAQAIAAGQVSDQIAPIQANIKADQLAQQGAAGAIGTEFKSILPSVQTSAQQVQQFNQNAQQASQQIFQAAGAQMNSLQQNQAAEAQRVAQATGGPVSTGQFTAAMDPYQQAEVASGAVGQLTTLNLGLGADMSAQKWAGQVFPAMETEQLSSNRLKYENDIKSLRDQINQIGATKSKLAAAALPGLLNSARNYKLQTAAQKQTAKTAARNFQIEKGQQAIAKGNLALNRTKTAQSYKLTQLQIKANAIKSAHAWEATKRGLDQQDKTLSLATQRENWNEGVQKYQLGQGDRRITQEGQRIHQTQEQIDQGATRLSQAAKAEADKMHLSYKEYYLRQTQYEVSDRIASERVQVTQEKNAMNFLDGLTGGKNSNKPITVTVRKNLDPSDPLAQAAANYNPGSALKQKMPTNVYHDPKTGEWYTFVHTTMTPSQFTTGTGASGVPVTQPTGLYNALKSAMPSAFTTKSGRQMIIGLINSKLGIKGWAPGKTTELPNSKPGEAGRVTTDLPNATAQSLANVNLSDLTDMAVKLGFPASPKAVSRQHLIDFILGNQHKVG